MWFAILVESPPPGYMSEDGDSQAVGLYNTVVFSSYYKLITH